MDRSIRNHSTNSVAAKVIHVKNKKDSMARLAIPLLVFNVAFFLFAHLYFFVKAFNENKGRGVVEPVFTLENFAKLYQDPYYGKVILTTLLFGIGVVLISGILAYPISYFITRSRRFGRTLLILTAIAAFTSVIVRAMGLRVLLGQSGPVNGLLMFFGVVQEPVQLVNNMAGALIGTVHAVLPFMILSLFPVFETISISLEEASASLGASWFQTFRRVIFPLSIPSLMGGSLLVFAITLSSFTTPALLGGANVNLLAVAIRAQLSAALNTPMAAALSIVLLLMVAVVVLLGSAVSRRLTRRFH